MSGVFFLVQILLLLLSAVYLFRARSGFNWGKKLMHFRMEGEHLLVLNHLKKELTILL